jgi:DUF971 family protein
MPDTKVRPTGITLNKKDKEKAFLEIEWNDGTTCQYPLSHLREACPCVECRGGHQYMGMKYAPDNLLTLTPARSYDVLEILPVGNYAIQPVWDDGHDTGIYTWEYLRHICPDDMDAS